MSEEYEYISLHSCHNYISLYSSLHLENKHTWTALTCFFVQPDSNIYYSVITYIQIQSCDETESLFIIIKWVFFLHKSIELSMYHTRNIAV